MDKIQYVKHQRHKSPKKKRRKEGHLPSFLEDGSCSVTSMFCKKFTQNFILWASISSTGRGGPGAAWPCVHTADSSQAERQESVDAGGRVAFPKETVASP